MRKLIFAINLTIDGCCDHTKMIPEEGMYDFYIRLLHDADTFVYGRKTYQLMVPYWPDIAKDRSGDKEENAYADAFESVENIVVFSRTLETAERKNTRIVGGNLEEEIRKMKDEPGKNILTGGADIPSQLIELGLVDEYHIVIHPVIAGEGRRLMEGINLPKKLQLKLVDSKSFTSGSMALHYVK